MTVAGRVLEPRDVGSVAPVDAALVARLVDLGGDAALVEPGDRLVDVLHREVEAGVLGGYVVRLRVHEHGGARAQVQAEEPHSGVGDLEPESLP